MLVERRDAVVADGHADGLFAETRAVPWRPVVLSKAQSRVRTPEAAVYHSEPRTVEKGKAVLVPRCEHKHIDIHRHRPCTAATPVTFAWLWPQARVGRAERSNAAGCVAQRFAPSVNSTVRPSRRLGHGRRQRFPFGRLGPGACAHSGF